MAQLPDNWNFEGSQKVLRVIFRLVAQGEDTIAADSNKIINIEQLVDLDHAFYLPPSVFEKASTGSGTRIFFDGPGVADAVPVTPNHLFGLHVTLFKQFIPGTGAQTQVAMYLANTVNFDIDFSYEVYRLSGLK